ncbi:DUF2399 domain-containing protein [Glycomyces sp. L485]|uniref:DUF2399 domain-containing protein n=1 Tax=Glycomyces sp. L485 TaxID=2909235 RepID=UPI00321B34EC
MGSAPRDRKAERAECEQRRGIVLAGSRAFAPWDPELSDAMVRRKRAVMEESLITELLADLASSC